MRKVICLVLALLMGLNLGLPAFAAEDGFVPSITYKPYPEVVPVTDAQGEEHAGVIRDENGEILDYVDQDGLDFAAVADIWDENADVPEETRKLLEEIYTGLNDGSIPLPDDTAVIRDLFDISLSDPEQRARLEEKGTTFEITFDLGVVADARIQAMVYDEETGEWIPAIHTVNNGDGTVTCTFDRLGVVAFTMGGEEPADSPAEEEPSGILDWIADVVETVVEAIVGVIRKLFGWLFP